MSLSEADKLMILKDLANREIAVDIQNVAKCIQESEGITFKEVNDFLETLKKEGVLKFRATLNPHSQEIGQPITVFHFYKCKGIKGVDEMAEQFLTNADIRNVFDIEEIHSVVGEWDIVVKFRVKDLQEYHERILKSDVWEILDEYIHTSRGFITTKTYMETARYEI